MTLLRDIAGALGLLTVVPVRGAEGEHPVAYFTLVGWLFTAIAAALVWVAGAIDAVHGLVALLVAALVLGAWALLSGALHWDGLADCADGIGVRGDATRRLAVMRDSTIGAFGVVAVVLVALVQVTALAVVIDSGAMWALGAPVIARCAAGVALWTRRPARDDGLGARYAGQMSLAGILLLMLPLLPLALVPVPSAARAVAVLGSLAVGALVPGLFARRLDGITGDVLGATIVLTETFVLVLGALVGGAV